MTQANRPLRLDQLPLRQTALVTGIDWKLLRENEARRLRELGFDEGVRVEKLHQGPIGLDPIACRVGRMTVAIRRAHAAAISVTREAGSGEAMDAA
jgi:ferrous iron transport protein A